MLNALFNVPDLLVEIESGAAFQRCHKPVQAGSRRGRPGLKPGGFRVEHVGQYQHCERVFIEPVGHLFQANSDVLLADLLSDDQEGYCGVLMVKVSHQACQHGCIAHSSIENTQSRGTGAQAFYVQCDAVCDDLLFAAGANKEQVLFAVVVEPERAVGAIGQSDLRRRAEISRYFRDRARPYVLENWALSWPGHDTLGLPGA